MATQTTGGGSATSFTNTPQAGDDSYTYWEDLLKTDSTLYNSATNTILLDVMANDKGGSAKTLFSVDDGDGNPITSDFDLISKDVDSSGSSPWQATLEGNWVRINNGKIEYRIADGSGIPGHGVSVDTLSGGEVLDDQFVYAIRLGNGTLSEATVHISITGANDNASIAVDPFVASDTCVIEAGGVANGSPGDPSASGKLIVTDVDSGENHFQAPPSSALTGTYGTFTFNASTGDWTYTLDNGLAATQALNNGDVRYDTLTVTSADGTASETITVTLHGANDAAVISGDASGDATEAGGVANGTAGSDATGDLNSTDVDNAADAWTAVAVPAAGDNGYGSYTIDASGHWVYSIDNANAAVQALNAGDTLTDTFTVTTVDGTSQQVTVTLHGANDAAVISGATTGSVTEDAVSNIATGDLNSADVDNPNDSWTAVSSPTATSGGYGTYMVDASGHWTYSLDNGNSAVNALNSGDTLTDTFTVATVDGTSELVTVTIHGATDAPANAAPAANADTIIVSTNTTMFLSADWLLANDVDPDGDHLTITAATTSPLPSGWTVSPVTVGGVVTGFNVTTSGANSASATLSYTISDGNGHTSTASFTIDTPGTPSTAGNNNIDISGASYNFSYIDALAGSDTVAGNAGLDTFIGGDGADTITGGAGDDLIVGGLGNDSALNGGAGNDIIRGGVGNDTIDGGNGVDLIDFSDSTVANTGIVFTLGAGGSGSFNAGAVGLGTDGYSNIEGVVGTAFNDSLTGNSGDNVLRGGGGNDTLNGMGGVDLIDLSDATAGGTFTLGAGGSGSIAAAGTGTDSYSNMEGIVGTAFDDVITGNAGDNVLQGGAGNDTLNGGDGNDILVGGAGANILTGGNGNDTFVITPPLFDADTITDYNISGSDTIDVTRILSVASGTDVASAGYLRVTTTGLLQVDVNGGGDTWVTIAHVNTGPASYSIAYLSGGAAATVSLAPVAPPIGIDLNGDGQVGFIGTNAGVTFDYGYGKVSTAWIAPEDGILVRDSNQDGQVTHDEMVFSTGGSDLEGLAVYDSNHDGTLDARDAAFGDFAVWQDANSNGVVDPGELLGLAALGITSISLTSDGIGYSAAGGDVTVVGTGSYTRADGTTGVLADSVFATGCRTADDQQRTALTGGSSLGFAGAVAAAGLLAEPLHADVRPIPVSAGDAAGTEHSQIVSQGPVTAAADTQGLAGEAQMPPEPAHSAPAAMAVSNDDQAAHQDLSGPEPAYSSGPAPSLSEDMSAPTASEAADPAPAGVSAVSAGILQAAMAGVAQHVAESVSPAAAGAVHGPGEIGQVLADALAGGSPDTQVDALLSAIPSSEPSQSALAAALAPHAGLGMESGALAFSAVHMALGHDLMMVHQDAAPAVA
jgi:VCBS repeat-containing protein